MLVEDKLLICEEVPMLELFKLVFGRLLMLKLFGRTRFRRLMVKIHRAGQCSSHVVEDLLVDLVGPRILVLCCSGQQTVIGSVIKSLELVMMLRSVRVFVRL